MVTYRSILLAKVVSDHPNSNKEVKMSYSHQKAWALFLVVFLLALGPHYVHGQDDQADLAKAAQPVGFHDQLSLAE